jgi:hypothetical protein
MGNFNYLLLALPYRQSASSDRYIIQTYKLNEHLPLKRLAFFKTIFAFLGLVYLNINLRINFDFNLLLKPIEHFTKVN